MPGFLSSNFHSFISLYIMNPSPTVFIQKCHHSSNSVEVIISRAYAACNLVNRVGTSTCQQAYLGLSEVLQCSGIWSPDYVVEFMLWSLAVGLLVLLLFSKLFSGLLSKVLRICLQQETKNVEVFVSSLPVSMACNFSLYTHENSVDRKLSGECYF